jgi:5-methylcytosine-specific restriction protein A
VNIGFYQSSMWRRIRARYLAEHSICEACDQALAKHVHHIQPIESGGAKRDWANLMSVCAACHTKIHTGRVAGRGA